MITRFFLLLTFLFPLSVHAQLMSPTNYRIFIRQLDSRLNQWEQHVQSLDVDQLGVSYAVGKNISGSQGIARETIQRVRRIADAELDHKARLSNRIALQNELGLLTDTLWILRNLLPPSQQGSRWSESVAAPMQQDVSNYVLPLQKHVDAYADELQSRAERCLQ